MVQPIEDQKKSKKNHARIAQSVERRTFKYRSYPVVVGSSPTSGVWLHTAKKKIKIEFLVGDSTNRSPFALLAQLVRA